MRRLVRVVGRLPAADDLTGLRFVERRNQIDMKASLAVLFAQIPAFGRQLGFKGRFDQCALAVVQVVAPGRAVAAPGFQQGGYIFRVVILGLHKAARAAVVVVAVSVGQILTPKEVRTAPHGCGPRLH